MSVTMSRYDEGLPGPRTLTDREQLLLLRTSAEHRAGFRDHLLIALALGTALREHELVALNVGDVLDADARARRRVVLRVYKRSHDDPALQTVLLPDRLRAKLEKFFGWKSRQREDVGAAAPLFVSRRGTRLSTRQVRRLVHLWQRRAGIDAPLNFHALRHTACTNLYRATKDIRLTQRFARHGCLRSTVRYTHPSDEELMRSIQTLPC